MVQQSLFLLWAAVVVSCVFFEQLVVAATLQQKFQPDGLFALGLTLELPSSVGLVNGHDPALLLANVALIDSEGTTTWGASSKPFAANHVNSCVNTFMPLTKLDQMQKLGSAAARARFALTTATGYEIVDSKGTVSSHTFHVNGTQVLWSVMSWSFSPRLNKLVALGWAATASETTNRENNTTCSKTRPHAKSRSYFGKNKNEVHSAYNGPQVSLIDLETGDMKHLAQVSGQMFLMCACAMSDTDGFFYYALLDQANNQFAAAFDLWQLKQYHVPFSMDLYGSFVSLSVSQTNPGVLFAWTELGQLWMIQPTVGLKTLIRQLDTSQGRGVLGASFSEQTQTDQVALLQSFDGSYVLVTETADKLNATYQTVSLGRTLDLGLMTLAPTE